MPETKKDETLTIEAKTIRRFIFTLPKSKVDTSGYGIHKNLSLFDFVVNVEVLDGHIIVVDCIDDEERLLEHMSKKVMENLSLCTTTITEYFDEK